MMLMVLFSFALSLLMKSLFEFFKAYKKSWKQTFDKGSSLMIMIY